MVSKQRGRKMNALDELSNHIDGRILELQEAKSAGTKMIGFVPNGYLPEEIIEAAAPNAMPVALARGGENEPVLYSGSYIPRWVDTFYRSQVGYKMLRENVLYNMVDMLVSSLLDCNQRAMCDAWAFFEEMPCFMFGVPHEKTNIAFDYYNEGVALLKQKIEETIGTSISDQKIKEAIKLTNKQRELFKEISLLRKESSPVISGFQFAKLNHDSLIAEKGTMIGILEQYLNELKNSNVEDCKGPRIMVTGGTLAVGDYKVLRMIEALGGNIVIEHFDTGLRDYWNQIETGENLLFSVADSYYNKKVPSAVFRNSMERQDFLIHLAKDFNVQGIISYELMYSECLQIDMFSFNKKVEEELGIPMIRLMSEYDPGESGALRTRIETFIETIRS